MYLVLIEPKHGFIKTAKIIIKNANEHLKLAHLSLLGVLVINQAITMLILCAKVSFILARATK